MNWGQYLSRGVTKPITHEVIYHMCIKSDFDNQISTGGLYYPPTYAQDGFIHATADPNLLLSIGTHFYKADRNEWICLEILVTKLISPVKYEPGKPSTILRLIHLAAPVGSTASHTTSSDKLFPHIYGGINADAVSISYPIIRSLDGSFHSIHGLVEGLANISLS